MNLKHEDFEDIAKVVKNKFKDFVGYDEGDIEIEVWLRQVDAVVLIKRLAYTQGNYVSQATIESMGGCSFIVNKVKFKIQVK